jgi:ABC-type branched-subunit amino acid transport system ATPase component
MLTVKDLRAGYGSAQILNGVDLAVQPREVVALPGRNGVGKTTLMKALMGIVPQVWPLWACRRSCARKMGRSVWASCPG